MLNKLKLDSQTNLLIHPIRIPTPFAVGDVFCYLITDEKIVLVDCGHFSDDAFTVVSDQLNNFGFKVSEIDEIWITHGHPDHYGQAAKLADRSGAVVYGHPKERANFAGDNDRDLFREFYQKHNIPADFIEEMIEQLDWLQQFQQPIEPEPITQDDQLTSGDLMVKVQFTPGHAPGHVAFKSNKKLIFSGDLLLAHISTNALINFDPDTGKRNKSLLQYRESLQWIRKQKGTVLPGHGEVIQQIPEVVDHHLNEHETRYRKIQQLLRDKPMNLMEISYNMFPDAIKKDAIFLVLSEVLGYLDWGIEEGTIELDKDKKYHALNG